MKPRDILAAVLQCPATALVGLAAILFTGWHWAGHDVMRWTLDARAFHGEPWRLVTSAFPHAGIFHLGFNLYWLWVFGSRIEIAWGSIRTTALMAVLAAGSNMAEYAVLDGGIGLSGVGYGLFGLVWVLEKRDSRFHGAIDRRTTEVFVGWFFLCIVLTAAKVMGVANFAHAAGWALGVLIGYAATAESRTRRALFWLAVVSSLLLTTLGSTFGRRFVNFSPDIGLDLAIIGTEALQDDDFPRAVEFLEQAVAANGHVSGWWRNLGIAFEKLERFSKAADAFERAYELDPSAADMRQAAAYCRARAGGRE